MPKTGESNKERRERTENKGSYRGEQGTKDHWMGSTETARRVNEDMIYDAAKRREGRKGLFAPIERKLDTDEMMEKAKDLNKYFNPNTRGSKFAKGGNVMKYAAGGSTAKPPRSNMSPAELNDWRAGQDEAEARDEIAKKTPVVVKPKPPVKMASGGSVSSRADGCCTKGKTKGRFV